MHFRIDTKRLASRRQCEGHPPTVVEIVVSTRPLPSENSFCAFRFNASNWSKAASIDAGLG